MSWWTTVTPQHKYQSIKFELHAFQCVCACMHARVFREGRFLWSPLRTDLFLHRILVCLGSLMTDNILHFLLPIQLLYEINMMRGIVFSAKYTQGPIRHVHEPVETFEPCCISCADWEMTNWIHIYLLQLSSVFWIVELLTPVESVCDPASSTCLWGSRCAASTKIEPETTKQIKTSPYWPLASVCDISFLLLTRVSFS